MKKFYLYTLFVVMCCTPTIHHAKHGNHILMGSFMGAGMGAALGGYDGILPGMITGLAVGTTAELLDNERRSHCSREAVYCRETKPSRQWLEDRIENLEYKLQKAQQHLKNLEHELTQKDCEIEHLRQQLKKKHVQVTQRQELIISAQHST